MSDEPPITIVYDGECPFCTRYVRMLRLRRAYGTVELVDARQAHPVVDRVKAAGIVLDQEMALVDRDHIYSGADCIHRLALMSTRSGLFNWLAARAFSSPGMARFAYPILRAARNATLRLLGRPQLPI